MNLQDIFIPYEQSKELKELGFDEKCLGFYLFNKKLQLSCASFAANSSFKDSSFKEVSAPTWEQSAQYLYKISNEKINIQIYGSDTYKELCFKLKQAISDLWSL